MINQYQHNSTNPSSLIKMLLWFGPNTVSEKVSTSKKLYWLTRIMYPEMKAILCYLPQVKSQTLELFRKLKDKLESVVADHDDDLDESKSCKIYENLYKVCSSIVHPYDSDYAEFLNVLFDKRHTQGNFQGCCEILRLILKSHNQNLPKYYSQIGITEMVLARNCKQTADQQSCVKEKVNLLEEGERTYCVSIFQEYQFYCWI